jgi:hypothetical protein
MAGISQQIALREPKLAANEEAGAAEEQFAALVRRQSRFVFRVAYSVLRNAHDAEDAVQEMFLSFTGRGPGKRSTTKKRFSRVPPGGKRLSVCAKHQWLRKRCKRRPSRKLRSSN